MPSTSVTKKARQRGNSTANVKDLLKQFDSRPGAIVPVDLLTTAEDSMKRYGMEVVLRRALPDYRDGLIPVRKRVLYAMYEEGNNSEHKVTKSAQAIGNTLARYHPHGDQAVYGCMQSMVRAPVPLLEGVGNWGSLLTGAADYRYTNARLSKFTDRVFFNSRYISQVPMVPNYDGTFKEPLYLPSMLPQLLINGLEGGVAVGVNGYVPSYTKASVKKVVADWMNGVVMTPQYLFETLQLDYDRYGAELYIADQAAMDDLVAFYQTGRGKALLIPKFEVDRINHVLSIFGHAPMVSPQTVMELIRSDESRFPFVMDINERTDKNTKTPMRLDVLFREPESSAQFQKWCNLIVNQFSWRMHFNLNLVERYIEPKTGREEANFRRFTLVEFINTWCNWRLQLEKDTLAHEHGELKRQAAWIELRLKIATDPEPFLKAAREPNELQSIASLYGITEKEAEHLLAQKISTFTQTGLTQLHGKLGDLRHRIDLNEVDSKSPNLRVARETADL